MLEELKYMVFFLVEGYNEKNSLNIILLSQYGQEEIQKLVKCDK